MLVAEFDEVGQVSRSVVHPVPDVVDIGEFGVRAPRESATLVAPPDGDALEIGGSVFAAAQVEALPGRIVGADQHLGVAGQTPGHLSGHWPQHVDLCPAVTAGQEGQIGVHDHGGPDPPGASSAAIT